MPAQPMQLHMEAFDPDVLATLACPACRADLSPGVGVTDLTCASCGRSYPVVDGIPALIVERAGTSTCPEAGS